MRRETFAVAVGLCAILSAAFVSAQAGDNGHTLASDADDSSDVAQAKGLMSQIEGYRRDALKASADAQESHSAVALDCASEIARLMAGPYKYARVSMDNVLELAAVPPSPAAQTDIGRELQRIQIYFETMVTLHGKLQGCAGPRGGSVIDGRPTIDRTRGVLYNTDPNADQGDNNLNDLQVAAESTKSATKILLDD